MSLQGLRTKISGYVASALPIAGVLGYELDPQLVIDLLSDHGLPIVCAQALTSIGVHHYRNKANLDSDAEASDVYVEPDKKAPELAKSEIANKLDPVEEQVLQLSNGEFEDA